jgi:putative addiction module component (TIGR02574 family)
MRLIRQRRRGRGKPGGVINLRLARETVAPSRRLDACLEFDRQSRDGPLGDCCRRAGCGILVASMSAQTIRKQVLALPTDQKLSLVQDLWDSIAEDQKSLALSAGHARVIDERLARDEESPRAVVTWAAAVKEARRQVAKAKKRKPR